MEQNREQRTETEEKDRQRWKKGRETAFSRQIMHETQLGAQTALATSG